MISGILIGSIGTLVVLTAIAGVLDVVERVQTWIRTRRESKPRRESWAPRIELHDATGELQPIGQQL